jgi:hypothetical protein
MPYEDPNYITQLVPTQPQGGESISEGDNHLRAIKKAVKQSFPKIDSAVTSTPAELNAVGQTAVDVAKLQSDFSDLDTSAHGNIASAYYKGGSTLYSHNVRTIDKTPNNEFGTRVIFESDLDGDTPDHYAFSVTPVTGSGGRPIVVTVSNVTKSYIDFIAIDLYTLDGDWSFIEGGTVDFSLIVQDLGSGQ